MDPTTLPWGVFEPPIWALASVYKVGVGTIWLQVESVFRWRKVVMLGINGLIRANHIRIQKKLPLICRL